MQAREKDGEGVDPGEMIRGLVDVRRRLEMVRREREGRGRLVGVVVGESDDGARDDRDEHDREERVRVDVAGKGGDVSEARRIVEMDKRVGELEKLVGSVSATLDEVSATFGGRGGRVCDLGTERFIDDAAHAAAVADALAAQ